MAGGPHLTMPPRRVPHLRRGFIATKVGHFRGSENLPVASPMHYYPAPLR